MNASTATAEAPLRQAGMQFNGMPAGGLAPLSLNVLFQVRLGFSWAPRGGTHCFSPRNGSNAWRLGGFVTNHHE